MYAMVLVQDIDRETIITINTIYFQMCARECEYAIYRTYMRHIACRIAGIMNNTKQK